MWGLTTIAGCLCLAALGCAQANIGDGADAGGGGAPDALPRPVPTDAGPVARTLAHNTSDTIIENNSIACLNTQTGFHNENSYYRVYDLAGVGVSTDFEITSVDLGVEIATGSGASQPASVFVYRLTGALQVANLGTPLGSANLTIDDQSQTMLNVPITGTVPAGSTVVIEVFTPDGQATSETFFIGSNNLGESAPGFIRAPVCGIDEPTAIDTLGVTDAQGNLIRMHMVLKVNGIER